MTSHNVDTERFAVRTGPSSFAVLDPDEILWIDAAGNYVELNTTAGTYRIRGTMSSLEEQLAASSFRRIHRSTIVNLQKVRELHGRQNDYFLVLENGQRLNVGRTYRDRLPEVLGNGKELAQKA